MKQILTLCASVLALTAGAQTGGTVTIDTSVKGAPIAESMYGIFFEEINHSGDGGLYAELIQNRNFEEHQIPGGCTYSNGNIYAIQNVNGWNDNKPHNWWAPWDIEAKKYTAWSVTSAGCSVAREVKEMAEPLHAATPNAMQLVISDATNASTAQLINEGYWGIAVKDGAKYNLRFYLRTADYAGKVTAMVCDQQGQSVGSVAFDVDKSGAWTEYKGVIATSKTINDGTFRLEFSGNGTIDVDYVSLFPQDTFRGRENGLRRDVAEALEALNPNFIRWPGGCIVEGITLGNHVKWKETIGDPMTRPGEYDSWGYRCTWGLGYHEALLFAEDLGMDFMYVGNLGMACSGRNADYVNTREDLDPYISDIRDAIEYAIGDPATNQWAKLRADAGHPEPFSLKYVELGNENFGPHYARLFNWGYETLKAEYPQLTFINTMAHFDADMSYVNKTDMVDPHWYQIPEWFFTSSTFEFDNIDRSKTQYDIYVGEYACNYEVGQGNLEAALAEAVFMNNMERNGDIVKMTSYAPLISNQNRPDWQCNMIWVNSDQCVGRSSYWAQQLYANNRPDYNVRSKAMGESRPPYAGRVALGTWATKAEFRNVKVTSPVDGRVLFEDALSEDNGMWSNPVNRGNWVYEDGVLKQTNLDQATYFTMDLLSFGEAIFEVECRKTGGNEGFLINLGVNDNDIDHSWRFNVGGWNNTFTALENATGYNGNVVVGRVPMSLKNDQWYTVKMVGHNGTISCYIDNELIQEITLEQADVKLGRVNMAAGYDSKNGEVVAKIVNANPEAMTAKVVLNADNIQPKGYVTTLGNKKSYLENSFQDPDFISPETTEFGGFAKEFTYTFLPNSLTIFRVKASEATSAIDFPGDCYSDAPVALTPMSNLDKVDALLSRLIARAEYSAAIPGVLGAAALNEAIITAKLAGATDDLNNDGKIDWEDRTEASVLAAWSSLCVSMEEFYQANFDQEYEVTSQIENPDFASGTQQGWHGSTVTINHNVAEYYNGRFGIYQDVDGLANGYYMLTVQGFFRHTFNPWQEPMRTWAEHNAILSANDQSVPLRGLYSNHDGAFDWSMAGAEILFNESQFSSINYVICEVTDGTLHIDLSKDVNADGDWAIWNNFRLFAVGESARSLVEDVVAQPNENDLNAPVYDIAGRRVGTKADTRSLAPGIYISAGKKFVVK